MKKTIILCFILTGICSFSQNDEQTDDAPTTLHQNEGVFRAKINRNVVRLEAGDSIKYPKIKRLETVASEDPNDRSDLKINKGVRDGTDRLPSDDPIHRGTTIRDNNHSNMKISTRRDP